jgi:dihydrofolate synthase/folylpolyglutamate synthase
VQTWRSDWGPLELPLFGPHQAHNAAIALAALDAMAESGLVVDRSSVERGWSSLSWPARVEVVGRSPWVIIDGAHNVASAQALADTLRTCFPAVPRTLVFGTTREKDLGGQLRALLPLFDIVIATRYLENPRSVPPEEIAREVFDQTNRMPETAISPAEALQLARQKTSENGIICVTGSLFLAAETRALLVNPGFSDT